MSSAIGTYPRELAEYCSHMASLASAATAREATEFKPGNANRYRDLPTVGFSELVLSATLSVPYYWRACVYGYYGKKGVYRPLYESVLEIQRAGVRFSILGTAILLYPLLYESPNASSSRELTAKASQLVRALDGEEAEWFLKAISLIPPSYLGKLEGRKDYREFKGTLTELLAFSANYDEVIKDLFEGYKLSLRTAESIRRNGVTSAYLELLCEVPDTLIMRKHGARKAMEVSRMACEAFNGLLPLQELDSYLLREGLNPGSTADIIASALFLIMYDEWWNVHPDYKGYLRKGCSRVTRTDS